ncbi:MAG: hypothetical protein LC121_00820 [Anaerolineae bacterium]|nr:hypothetical protein [Anaerolineae bacterium]
MIAVDEQAYPVVVVRSEGDITLEDVHGMAQALEGVFARKTPCGVIMISDENAVSTQEARSVQARWLKQNKPRIAEICRGYALVLNSPAQLMLFKPIMALQGKRMMGCPAAVFGDIDAAQAWIREQLA